MHLSSRSPSPKTVSDAFFIDVFPAGLRACFTRRGEPVGGCSSGPQSACPTEHEVCIKRCHAPVPFIQTPSFTLTAPIRFIRFAISPTRLNSESRLTSTRGRLGSEDQKGWGALTLVGDLVGDLVDSSQHRPPPGATRQETVSRHLPSHASSHLSSVLLWCAR